MDGLGTKHRRKLNDEQLDVLKLLYKFRFGTNELFAQYFGKKDRSFVFKRLKILQEQGLVGKRFESSYRLQGKPAACYLMPGGARRLQEARNLQVNIKGIYKDKSVSEQFVERSLNLFAIRNQLCAQYGDDLQFFTKASMNHQEYDYFPQPLPDAYIRFKDSDKHFFLDVYYDDQPKVVAVSRMKQYVKYEEGGEWQTTGTDLPIVLAVCESTGLAKRVQRYMKKSLKESWDSEIVHALTTKADVMGDESDIWRRVDESDEKLGLLELHKS